MLVLKIGSTTSLSTGVLWFFCRLEAQLGETVVSASAGALSVLYPAHGVLIMVSLRLVPPVTAVFIRGHSRATLSIKGPSRPTGELFKRRSQSSYLIKRKRLNNLLAITAFPIWDHFARSTLLLLGTSAVLVIVHRTTETYYRCSCHGTKLPPMMDKV